MLALVASATPLAHAEMCSRFGDLPADIRNSERIFEFGRDDPSIPESERFTVLKPPLHGFSGRLYPVLILLHGSSSDRNSWLAETDLFGFTGPSLPDDKQAIVVMPSDPSGFWIDWHDGTVQSDSYIADFVIPFVDDNFLTDGARRAIAGHSAGGGGAAQFAARHPDLVSSLGALSGNYQAFQTARQTGALYPPGRAAVLNLANAALAGCDGQVDPAGLCGDPVEDASWCEQYDVYRFIDNLDTIDIDLFVGTGRACDEADVAGQVEDGNPGEPLSLSYNLEAQKALTDAGIAHELHVASCGVHTWRYAEKYLEQWWLDEWRPSSNAIQRTTTSWTADPEI